MSRHLRPPDPNRFHGVGMAASRTAVFTIAVLGTAYITGTGAADPGPESPAGSFVAITPALTTGDDLAALYSDVPDPDQVAPPPDPEPVTAQAAALRPAVSTTAAVAPSSQSSPSATVDPTADATGIPLRVLEAYKAAAASAPESCNLRWEFLAAFGRIESNHGRYGGSQVMSDGVTVPPIVGMALNGSNGTAAINNGGTPDRAAGPMQFITSTWNRWGNGGNVQDIDDATVAAAGYLCAGGRDLSRAADRHAAALSYNHAEWYAADVLALYDAYVAGGPGVAPPVAPEPVTPSPSTPAPTTPPAPTSPAPSSPSPTKPPKPTTPPPTSPSPSPTEPSPTDPSPTEPTPDPTQPSESAPPPSTSSAPAAPTPSP